MRLLRPMPVALLALLVGACLPSPTPRPTEPPSPIPSGSTASVHLATPALGTVSPGPAAAEPAPCPILPSRPFTPDWQAPALSPQGLLAFLNGGGTPQSLAESLRAAGRGDSRSAPVLALDINGDAWLDLVVAFTDPSSLQASGRSQARPLPQPPSSGTLVVFVCQHAAYAVGDPLLSQPDRTPRLFQAGDLTADGIDDAIVGWEACGAHTCFQDLDVITATGTHLSAHRLAPTDDLPYPAMDRLPDGTLAVTGTGIGSAGAGPYRQSTRVWAWSVESAGFTVLSEHPEPPRFRIHALLDAEAAAGREEWDLALDLYHRVILDDTLLDWADPQVERANLTGYSMFRVVVTYVRLHDLGDARVAYGILQNQYADSATGQAYAALGTAFWETFSETEDLELSCDAARSFASANSDLVLKPLYFGYANPPFTAEQVCPVGTP